MRPTQPSITALAVARQVAFAGADPERLHLLPAGTYELTRTLLAAHSPRFAREQRRFLSSRWRSLYSGFEHRTWMRGGVTHLALRKRFVDEHVRVAIAAGARRVIVLGAGFDVLALRLAREFADVAFVEVDHPATQIAKRRALAAVGSLPENLSLLERILETTGAAPSASTSTRTVYVAEGLLMYLEPAAVDALFAELRAAGPGTRIVFTFVGLDDRGRPRIGRWPVVVRAMLRAAGEPFRFGIEPADLPRFLHDRGWRLIEQPDDPTLLARYDAAGTLTKDPSWEYLAAAEFLDPALPRAGASR